MKLNPRLSVLAGLIVLFAAVQGLASPITANVYVFTNFDLPGSGNAAGAGTNINGIANNGAAVGLGIDNNGVLRVRCAIRTERSPL